MKSQIYWIFSFLILLLLSACVTEAEREQQRQAQHETYMASLRQTCTDYGFQPATMEFAKCMQTLDERNQQKLQQRASRPNPMWQRRQGVETNCTPNIGMLGGFHCTTR